MKLDQYDCAPVLAGLHESFLQLARPLLPCVHNSHTHSSKHIHIHMLECTQATELAPEIGRVVLAIVTPCECPGKNQSHCTDRDGCIHAKIIQSV